MPRKNEIDVSEVKKIAERFKGLPDKKRCYEVLDALMFLDKSSGFKTSHFSYLALMVDETEEADWRGGKISPVVWLTVEEIAGRLRVSTATVNKIEKELIALKAIYLRNAKDYYLFDNEQRDKKRRNYDGGYQRDGYLRYPYVVDLRPLVMLPDVPSSD